jgi:general secretion pathway protein A
MYKKFFGLRSSPFNVNPDPRFLFLTPHVREALACLTYGIHQRKGFVLLTGEVGTGKTTAINKLLEWLRGQQVPSAFIFNPRLTISEFFSILMHDFEIPCDAHDKSQVILGLNAWLLAQYREGKTAVLVIDEAQHLSTELLEEIRLLTNLETSTEKLLQIVLCGQPELDERLKRYEMRQLRQRITLRAQMYRLTNDETHRYIEQRLRIAGANGQVIFSPAAMDHVFAHAQGNPRITNLICEHALISAFADQNETIEPAIVDAVARDFQLYDDAARHPELPLGMVRATVETIQAKAAGQGEN